MGAQIAFRDFLVDVDDTITFNYQTASVGDLSLSRSNYTSSFNIPRTTENQSFFDGLGIPADTSQRPYIASNVDVMQDYAIIYSGTLVVLKTTREYYQATVISGAFDLFSVLGDKRFSDIDISDVVHSKTKETVRDRITNTNGPYAYFIGAFAEIQNFDQGLNVDAMPVAVKLQYLMDRIFAFAQMSYTLPSSLSLENEYMTFPYPPYAEVIAGGGINNFTVNKSSQNLSFYGELNDQQYRTTYGNWNGSSGSGFTVSGFDLVCSVAGQYIISFDQCVVQVDDGNGNNIAPVTCRLVSASTGYVISQFTTDTINGYDGNPTFQTAYSFSAGEVMRVEFHFRTPLITVMRAMFNNIVLNMQSLTMSPDGINRTFGFGLADFIKEIMYRYALIPFMNGTTVDFVALDDIINYNNNTPPLSIINWTDKYIERTEESYDIGYSQNNYLRHKYADAGVDIYDRNIQSNNLTLSASKTIIESKVFAPPLETTEVIPYTPSPGNTVESRRWITYDVTANGSSVNVKTENRNFFVQIINASLPNGYTIRLTSPTLPGASIQFSPTNFNVGAYTAGFANSQAWNNLLALVTNTRQHIITLHLNDNDARVIDQTKLYYFQQEQAYYVLSKLQYKKGEPAKGEFIKVNYNID